MNGNPTKSLNVLVVEDELLIATSLEIALESHGHTLLGPVATVKGAQKALETSLPDIAFIDYRLADSTTEPLLPLLRERGIAFCVLSGYGREQLPAAYGSCHLLEKPFRMRKLMAMLEILRKEKHRDGE